jgi:hypothetical protein
MSIRAPLAGLDEAGRAGQTMPRPPEDSQPGSSPSTGRSLSPRARKALVAAHVVVSVGLLGLSTAMLVLAAAGFMTSDVETAQAAYRSMAILTRGPVPLVAVAAVATGVILALGTKWGLFKHLWIVTKLALTVAVILSGIFVIGPSVQQATSLTLAAPSLAPPERGSARLVLLLAASANVLMLVAATVISFYKPWGALRRGRPASEARRLSSQPMSEAARPV